MIDSSSDRGPVHANVMPIPVPIPEDLIEELTELDSALVDELGVRFSTERWGYDQFNLILPDKWRFSRIARAAQTSRLVGYWIASRPTVTRLHTHRVGVGKSSRGSGVGEALYSTVASEAADAGIRTMTLLVPEENEAAAAFYHRVGFRPLLGDALGGFKAWLLQKGQLDADRGCVIVNGGYLRVMIAEMEGQS